MDIGQWNAPEHFKLLKNLLKKNELWTSGRAAVEPSTTGLALEVIRTITAGTSKSASNKQLIISRSSNRACFY